MNQNHTLPEFSANLRADGSKLRMLDVSYGFFMKDIYDRGYNAVKGMSANPHVSDSLFVTRGYTLLDEAIDPETGKERRDFYIWTALARLMITAGDINTAAAYVIYTAPANANRVTADDPMCVDEGEWQTMCVDEGEWQIGYLIPEKTESAAHDNNPTTSYKVFMKVEQTDKTLDEFAASIAFPHRAMGSIDPASYIAKLGAYPMATHPRLVQRSITGAVFVVIDLLTQTGLQVLGHWQPNDTSKDEAYYYLSDGVTHYVVTFNAPQLRDALIVIDRTAGRTEDDGAIVPDAKRQTYLSSTLEELDESSLETLSGINQMASPETAAADYHVETPEEKAQREADESGQDTAE